MRFMKSDKDSLKEIIEIIEKDHIIGSYYQLQKKLMEINKLLDVTDLSQITLDNKDDGTWERIMKLFSSIGDINDVLKKLRIDNGLTGNKEEDIKKSKSIIERFAQ